MRRSVAPLILGSIILATRAPAQAAPPAPPPEPPVSPAPTEGPPLPPPQDPAQAPGLLAGPKVDEASADPAGGGFGGPDRQRQRDRLWAVRPARWFQIVRSLELSPQQRQALEGILTEFQRARREFEKENGQEIAELRRSLRQARESDEPFPQELLRQMQALLAKGPSVESYQKRAWELLDEPQQEALRARLQEIHKDRQALRERAAWRRGGRGSAGSPEGMESAPDQTPGGDSMDEGGSAVPRRDPDRTPRTRPDAPRNRRPAPKGRSDRDV